MNNSGSKGSRRAFSLIENRKYPELHMQKKQDVETKELRAFLKRFSARVLQVCYGTGEISHDLQAAFLQHKGQEGLELLMQVAQTVYLEDYFRMEDKKEMDNQLRVKQLLRFLRLVHNRLLARMRDRSETIFAVSIVDEKTFVLAEDAANSALAVMESDPDFSYENGAADNQVIKALQLLVR